MKKFLTILFVSLYFMLSAGVFISIHYCGGKMKSVAVMDKAKSCCGTENEEINNGCCSNEELYVHLDVDQQHSQVLQLNILQAADLPVQIEPVPTADASGIYDLIEFNIPPPKDRPLWLLYSNFTYYG